MSWMGRLGYVCISSFFKASYDRLLHDSHRQIQEQAVNVLRNLACGKEKVCLFFQVFELICKDIDAVFNGYGIDRLIRLIEDLVLSSSDYDDLLLQVIYVIVNIATGNAKHKEILMCSTVILKQLYTLLVIFSVWNESG